MSCSEAKLKNAPKNVRNFFTNFPKKKAEKAEQSHHFQKNTKEAFLNFKQ